eukprot:CAMPEP_0115529022 /NCGR_PEP_ID=MMETSP0271-20121206/83709_1 /TAXON_ID=71861 /ORGANISM="Scrippsiella trochoidea, Strain CCMP3099" /LENGTH=104 /DNA_ID=CAMNT_0002960995 /DNA_START=218 /DNA_END=532 /DNA_ORIENTATION=-
MRYHYKVFNRLLVAPPRRLVHETVKGRPELSHAVVHVSAGFAIGEAIIEAAKFCPLCVNLFHLHRVLEIPEVLLPQPRLRGHIDLHALEVAQDRFQRLQGARVR